MEVKINNFTIYKNGRDDIAFIISYTGNKNKNAPTFIYERLKNSAILKKSDDLTLVFSRININATLALRKSTRLYVIETENDIVQDEYWVNIRM